MFLEKKFLKKQIKSTHSPIEDAKIVRKIYYKKNSRFCPHVNLSRKEARPIRHGGRIQHQLASILCINLLTKYKYIYIHTHIHKDREREISMYVLSHRSPLSIKGLILELFLLISFH